MRTAHHLLASWGATALIAGVAAAGCDSSTAPGAGRTPAAIVAVTATTLVGTAGYAVAPVPAVRAIDAHGSPAVGVTIDFRTDAHGRIGRASVKTDANGIASAREWVLGPLPGQQTLTALHAGRTHVVFVATVEPGPATTLTGVGGTDQVGWLGQTLPRMLEVIATDVFGNPVEGQPVTFVVESGEGTIEGGYAVTDAQGIARSGPWTLGGAAGVQEVRASAGPAVFVFPATAYPAPPGRIAFVSERDGNPDIYVSAADGSGFVRLTTHPRDDGAPTWSPDGSRIAFISNRAGLPELYVMAADGSNVTRLAPALRPLGRTDWSPDGSVLAVSYWDGAVRIATLRLLDRALSPLPNSQGWEPSWSPDGQQLAFISDRLMEDFVFNIYTMNSNGTGLRLLTEGLAAWPTLIHYSSPAWSPGGGQIAFVSGRIINQTDVRYSVNVLDLMTNQRRELAWAGDIAWTGPGGPGSLAWSPDANGIAYTFVDCDLLLHSPCTHTRSVRYIALDGSVRGTIAENAHSPTWTR